MYFVTGFLTICQWGRKSLTPPEVGYNRHTVCEKLATGHNRNTGTLVTGTLIFLSRRTGTGIFSVCLNTRSIGTSRGTSTGTYEE